MRAVDLFAGAGGLSMGLSQAGFSVDLAVEADEAATKVYTRLHRSAEIWQEPVDPVKLRGLRGSVDLLAAGPPCQPFSSAGKRLGYRDPRDGFPSLFGAIDVMRPSSVLIENVVGLTQGERRPYFLRIQVEMKARGYCVASRVLDAADFGVRQHRRRVFVVATRDRAF
jgi:DNA (cytosine-5)-methyltransferase 1